MDCIFCKIIKKEIPGKIVYEDDLILAFMDIDPICDGHTLIIPKEHYATVFDAPDNVISHMYKVANKISSAIMEATNETGATFSINYGDNQEIKHVHMHVITNYNHKPSKNIDDVYKLIMEKMNG